MDKRPKVFNLMPMSCRRGAFDDRSDHVHAHRHPAEPERSEIFPDPGADGGRKVTEFYLDLNNGMVELALKEGTLAELEWRAQNQRPPRCSSSGFGCSSSPRSAQKDGGARPCPVQDSLSGPLSLIISARWWTSTTTRNPDAPIVYDMSQPGEFPWEVVSAW